MSSERQTHKIKLSSLIKVQLLIGDCELNDEIPVIILSSSLEKGKFTAVSSEPLIGTKNKQKINNKDDILTDWINKSDWDKKVFPDVKVENDVRYKS